MIAWRLGQVHNSGGKLRKYMLQSRTLDVNFYVDTQKIDLDAYVGSLIVLMKI